ncbi:MAG TPA: hypothetical protein G4N99_05150 [Thermoflexia bacterium]|nr:hypothetical protein [Thermoflexia bacterium]
MKRFSIPLTVLLIAVWLLLIAYASALSPPLSTTPAPRPTPRIQNTIYYTKRCWPACHYNTALVKPAPIPVVHDFDDTLESGWAWINEDPAHWSLTEVPGTLRIVSQAGSISDDLQDAQNVLVRDAPAGHFDTMTKVAFSPASDSQNATIFVQMDDGRLISLSRGYCQEGNDPSCVGSGVYFDGSDLGCARVGVSTSSEVVHMMLRKAGNSYIGYLLSEGDWVQVGRCFDATVTPISIGLTATSGESGAPEIPAGFDSFTLVERP